MYSRLLKGFIGPIGDDIPSLLAIMLALSLFFSALTFSFDAYNVKISNFQRLKGSIDIVRVVTQDGIITESLSGLKSRANTTARSYGVDFAMEYLDGSDNASDSKGLYCADHDNWLQFSYLVAAAPISLSDIELKTLKVCVG